MATAEPLSASQPDVPQRDKRMSLAEEKAALERVDTRDAPAGMRFRYSSPDSQVLGLVLWNALNKPVANYLSEKIWAPFGMESDALWPKDMGGHERGGCCLNMTLRDYARFGLFALGSLGFIALFYRLCRSRFPPVVSLATTALLAF